MAGVLLAANLLFMATAGASAETRTLKFYFLHTKERAEITYKRNGRYIKSGLDQISNILRDWRRDEPTKMNPRLLDLLWEVYRQSGSRDYIHVVSAYRSPETNAMLRKRSNGVAKKSQHMLGNAVDFYLPDVKLSKLRAIGLRLEAGGVGYYPRSGSPFVHMDVGGVRHWPRMSRKELASVFPDGKTLHVPSDGKPMPGYEQAVAAYEARQKNGGTIQVADDTSRGNRGRGLLARLFGGGADEEEDNAEAETVVAQRSPARQQQQQARQPEPPQAVAQAQQPQQPREADTPATILAALPARAVPVPREAPRPDLAVGADLPAQPVPAAEEAPLPEQPAVAVLNVPQPTPRPDYRPAEPDVQVAAAEDVGEELPKPVAYATPTRRPDLPASSDVIAALLEAEKDVPTAEPAVAAAGPSPARPTLAALKENQIASASAIEKAAAAAALPPVDARSDVAPTMEAQPVAASPRSTLLAGNGVSPAALVSSGAKTAPKGPKPGPEDASSPRPAVVVTAGQAPSKLVLSPRSVIDTRPQGATAKPALSPELIEAPTAVYTDGFRADLHLAEARRFTGKAVTFLALARFDRR